MKRKRIIKRSKGKDRKLYFNASTQEAIVEFQSTECKEEQSKIYREKIMPAFDKLVENLILIYGFSRRESFEVLKTDCVSFCYETLYKFDESKGTKAFSYFNVVAKNWLILNSRRTKKRVFSHVSISNSEALSPEDKMAVANYQIAQSPDDVMISAEQKQEITDILIQIKSKVEKPNDVSCINAIIKVFEMLDQLEFLNKRAIFVYVREISGLNSKQLSSSMSNIRRHYRQIKKDMLMF